MTHFKSLHFQAQLFSYMCKFHIFGLKKCCGLGYWQLFSRKYTVHDDIFFHLKWVGSILNGIFVFANFLYLEFL